MSAPTTGSAHETGPDASARHPHRASVSPAGPYGPRRWTDRSPWKTRRSNSPTPVTLAMCGESPQTVRIVAGTREPALVPRPARAAGLRRRGRYARYGRCPAVGAVGERAHARRAGDLRRTNGAAGRAPRASDPQPAVPLNAKAVVLSHIPLTTRTTGPGGTPPAPRTRPADHPFFTVSSLTQNKPTHELHTPILGACEQFISWMKSRSPISGCSGLFQPLNKCSHVRYVELHSSGRDHLSGNPQSPWLKTIT